MSPLSALVAAIVVPCTVAITFIVMKAAGLTFNMMTLGGLAAGIGLFIDDAIVMIEAIHRELRGRQVRRRSGSRGPQESSASANRLDDDGDRGVRAAGLHFGHHRHFLPVAGGDARRRTGDFAGPRDLLHTRRGAGDCEVSRACARSGTNLSRRSGGVSERGAALHPNSGAGNSGRDHFNGGGVLRLQQYRHRLSAAARRRRVYSRLHHAAAEHDGRHHRAARVRFSRF